MIGERNFRFAIVFLPLLIAVCFSVIVWHYMKVNPTQTSATETLIESQRDTIDRQRAELEEALRLVHHIDSLFALQRAEVKRLAVIKDSLVSAWQTQHDAQYTALRRMQVAAESEAQLISKLQKQLHDAGFYLNLNATGDTVPSVRLVAPTHPQSTRD